MLDRPLRRFGRHPDIEKLRALLTPEQAKALFSDNPDVFIAPGLSMEQYLTQGMWLAAEMLRLLDKPLTEVKELTCLDFGCGTGRTTRPLSFFFKSVVGYDPNSACIRIAREEVLPFPRMSLSNVSFTDDAEMLKPEYAGHLDVGIATNVFQHLRGKELLEAFALFRRSVRKGGTMIYNVSKGADAILRVEGSEVIKGDVSWVILKNDQ